MDLNIDNYTNDELIEILELEDPSNSNIIIKTDFYINKFKEEKKEDYVDFFSKVQKRLLMDDIISDTDSSSDEENEKRDFNTNNNIVNKNRNLTDRQELNIKENIEIPIKEGIINPNLKNIITKIVNVDSQFRQNATEENFVLNTTNFTIDLTHPLTNVLNMKLFSIQIPFTWYNIDSAYGTDYILVNDNKHVIESAYYKDWSSLKTKLNNISGLTFEQDSNTYKIKITENEVAGDKTVQFYNRNVSGNSGHINNNLGWLLGFRKQSYTIPSGGSITSEAVPDLYGPKYLFLEIDDFNQNHLNNTVVNSTDNHDVKLKRPSYFNRDLSYVIQDDGLFQLQPDENRTITQNQLYAFNAINTNLFNNQTFEKTSAPPTTDYIGIIPMKHTGLDFGDVFIENGGGMPINERSYFGPVNISRLAIKLLDDKGNILNLNGCDWSFSFVCDTLYQY
jgi:hypothetical protein